MAGINAENLQLLAAVNELLGNDTSSGTTTGRVSVDTLAAQLASSTAFMEVVNLLTSATTEEVNALQTALAADIDGVASNGAIADAALQEQVDSLSAAQLGGNLAFPLIADLPALTAGDEGKLAEVDEDGNQWRWDGTVWVIRGKSITGSVLDLDANRVDNTARTSSPALMRGTTGLSLVAYDSPSRSVFAPGEDKPHGGGPIRLVGIIDQSKGAGLTSRPPINTVMRRPLRAFMFLEAGLTGLGNTDATTLDLRRIGPAFEAGGETYFTGFITQLLAREDEAGLMPTARLMFNAARGSTDLARLAGGFPLWTELLALDGGADGELSMVSTDDTGTHSSASGTGYDGASVNNSGLYEWSDNWGRWVRTGDAVMTQYNNFINCVRAAYQYFHGNVELEVIPTSHCESDSGKPATYCEAVIGMLYDKLSTDLPSIDASIFGKTYDGTARKLHMIWMQGVTRTQGGIGHGPQDALLALDAAARASPANRQIHLGCVSYDRPYIDTDHYQPRSSMLKGAALGEAWWNLSRSEPTGAFRMTAASRASNIITVSTDAQYPLMIDTAAPMRTWTNSGFVVTDSGGTPQTISSVAINGGDSTKINITMAGSPAAGWIVLAGRTDDNATAFGPGGGTNIRDTRPAVADLRPDTPLYQWLLNSQVTVT